MLIETWDRLLSKIGRLSRAVTLMEEAKQRKRILSKCLMNFCVSVYSFSFNALSATLFQTPFTLQRSFRDIRS